MNSSFTIKEISPLDETVQAFIAQLDQANLALYPEGPNYFMSAEAIAAEGVMLGLFIEDKLIAMGALKWCDGYAEVKRIFVLESQRGRGLSKKIMLALETLAQAKSVSVLRLETGVRQPAAVGLYRSLGYQQIPCFGDYSNDPLSIFFEKSLVTHALKTQ